MTSGFLKFDRFSKVFFVGVTPVFTPRFLRGFGRLRAVSVGFTPVCAGFYAGFYAASDGAGLFQAALRGLCLFYRRVLCGLRRFVLRGFPGIGFDGDKGENEHDDEGADEA